MSLTTPPPPAHLDQPQSLKVSSFLSGKLYSCFPLLPVAVYTSIPISQFIQPLLSPRFCLFKVEIKFIYLPCKPDEQSLKEFVHFFPPHFLRAFSLIANLIAFQRWLTFIEPFPNILFSIIGITAHFLHPYLKGLCRLIKLRITISTIISRKRFGNKHPWLLANSQPRWWEQKLCEHNANSPKWPWSSVSRLWRY